MRHTQHYKITHQPGYHSFLISPKMIEEKALKFVYEQNGEKVTKNVDLKYIGPHLKFRRIYKFDDELLEYYPSGYAYSVNENVIFNAPSI